MVKKEYSYIISSRTKIIGLLKFKKNPMLVPFNKIADEHKNFIEIRPLNDICDVCLSSETSGKIYVIYKCVYTGNEIKQQTSNKLARRIMNIALS